MDTGSKLVLSGFLTFVALGFILVAGPIGIVAIPLVLIVAGFVEMASGGSDSTATTSVNCEGCGAPNDEDAEACHHCEEPL
ncbi:hypothetical protein [Natronomonas marina]|jgi:hypothetical protein|uniref:hypothetical protein n=1 Tax=Natronomonas marina TaxID=2961939 RepID=UPI0020CA1B98|nr:hypothetical protein [Natronomonas marina]